MTFLVVSKSSLTLKMLQEAKKKVQWIFSLGTDQSFYLTPEELSKIFFIQ